MPPLGFIRKQDRTNVQWDAHNAAEAQMLPTHALAAPALPKGTSVRLFDAWKDPLVVADVGFIFPRFHQLTGSCFPAGTPVRMDGSEKHIEDVQLGDVVITHEGRLRRVVDKMNRLFTGDMVTLHAGGFPPLQMTEDHPVAVLTCDGLNWIKADQIEEGSRVLLGPPRSHVRSVRRIERCPVEMLPVYDFEVEEDHSFIAGGLAVHNCIGAGGGQALFTLIATQRLFAQNPTKAFIPFWPYDYGKCRWEEGDRGRGEGAMGSAFAQTVVQDGVIDATTQGLPPFQNQDGLVLTSHLELDWSDGGSQLVRAYDAQAKVHPVGAAAICKNSQDIKAAITNGYPVTFACNNYIGKASVQGSGADAALCGYWDGRGGHQQSLHAVWENPTLGTLYFAQNNWPGSTYPSDPAGGPICGCWVTEAHVDSAMHNLDAEVYALSHLNWFPANPAVIPWILA